VTVALHGVSASKGIAFGPLRFVTRGETDVTERVLGEAEIEREVCRFEEAVARARTDLRSLRDQVPEDTPKDVADFMNVHLLMLEDAALTRAPAEIIADRRCNAEWALKLQRDALVGIFEAMDDPYLRTRKDDVEHVVARIQRFLEEPEETREAILTGNSASFGECIVFSEDLSPADAVLMHRQGVRALLTQFGGATSHTAILARSLGIPAVVGLHNARVYLREDEAVLVDGRDGVVLLAPDDRVTRHYRQRSRSIARYAAARRRLRNRPVLSADGQRIVLMANVELNIDVETALAANADGVGLYRTEFLFMNRRSPPDEEEQFEAYAELVHSMRGAPVTVRTVDLGADKQVDGVRPGAPATANPALGLRGLRLCLREPALFRPQLRAILRASALGPVRMMVPMLASIQELDLVKDFLAEARADLDQRAIHYDAGMPLGAMVEVPSAALCADLFARELDFLSIGTNDLIQYALAVDRVDDEVNYLYDPLHPAVLRLINMTIKAGQRAGIPVEMCGEMAADPRYTRLLLGMGLREFSVHPQALLEIKQIIGESRISDLARRSHRLLSSQKVATRERLIAELNGDRSDS